MEQNNSFNHSEIIKQIFRREFGVLPGRITRKTNGICNDVYVVEKDGVDVIVRLKDQARYMLGSHNHIPLFREKGIRVPEILAEDYTKSEIPLAYQVQSKLEGRDIREVINTLTDEQLQEIGAEIANVFRQLREVPNNGKFGVLWGDGNDLVDSWVAEVARVSDVVRRWGRQTGVLDRQLDEILTSINEEYAEYFDSVKPITYFGDIAGKNVMVHEGRFSGLVDLDSLAQGDPLEAIGRIKTSWYGTHYGQVYSASIIDALKLTAKQRKLVTMYALLNRVFWACENGIQFNQNTSPRVDRVREAEDKKAIADLYTELQTYRRVARAAKSKTNPLLVELPAEAVSLEENNDETNSAAEAPRFSKPEMVSPAISSNLVPEYSHVPEINEEPKNTESGTNSWPDGGNTVPDVIPPEEIIENRPETESVGLRREEETAHLLGDISPEPTAPAFNRKPAAGKSGRIVLEASGVSKTYVTDGIGFDAVKNVNLQISAGECIAIVGKSGSGKSTLMHLLACLDYPSEGYIYVEGEETSVMSESEKNILRNEKFGFVFQQFFLNGRDSVYENVVLPMRIRGESDAQISIEAEAALAAVGLTEKLWKKAKDLSGGEKQRVCIARALIGKPSVIFADEPTGNLDSATGAAVEKMLFGMNREKGITLVIVTHDPDLASRCSRIIEMKDGRIVAEQTAEVAAK